VKLGVALPIAGAWATPENQVEVARRAEALGFHSLWVFQRLLYALEPKNEYYGAPGPAWPAAFQRVVDPLVTLAYVAAVTSRIRLGTSVLLLPLYSPVVLAKQLATLDLVSGGRLEVGLGLGWSEDEYAAAGVAFARRGERADEFLRCLRAVWTEDEVRFDGAFYQVPRSRIEPKPVQRPHPPITLGGYHLATLRRAVTLADGYNGGNLPLTKLAPLVAELRRLAEAVGRDPATLRVVCRGSLVVHDTPQGASRRAVWGTLEEIREDLEAYAAAGVTELFLDANFDPRGPRVDRLVAALEALAPAAAASPRPGR
jgi:probable F420-dependent oxidoreductase